jgi:hypothetical protein
MGLSESFTHSEISTPAMLAIKTGNMMVNCHAVPRFEFEDFRADCLNDSCGFVA